CTPTYRIVGVIQNQTAVSVSVDPSAAPAGVSVTASRAGSSVLLSAASSAATSAAGSAIAASATGLSATGSGPAAAIGAGLDPPLPEAVRVRRLAAVRSEAPSLASAALREARFNLRTRRSTASVGCVNLCLVYYYWL